VLLLGPNYQWERLPKAYAHRAPILLQKLIEASAVYGDAAAVKGLVEGSGTHGAAAPAHAAAASPIHMPTQSSQSDRCNIFANADAFEFDAFAKAFAKPSQVGGKLQLAVTAAFCTASHRIASGRQACTWCAKQRFTWRIVAVTACQYCLCCCNTCRKRNLLYPCILAWQCLAHPAYC
jgi:hypothetical protein